MRTGEKWVIFLPKLGNWDVEPWVVCMDGVVMTFKTAGTLKPAVALSTWDHGCCEENSELAMSIYIS